MNRRGSYRNEIQRYDAKLNHRPQLARPERQRRLRRLAGPIQPPRLAVLPFDQPYRHQRLDEAKPPINKGS